MSTLDPVAVFRTEAAECLEAIEAGLLDLTHQLDNKDLVDAVFRGLHTLKGSGAMFGFEALAAFTHHCETAFDRVRKGEVAATSELVAAVLAAQDHMRALVDQPDADHGDTGNKLLAQLQAAVGGKQAAAAAAPAAVPPPAAVLDAPAKMKNSWRIRFSLPANSMANGTNPLGLLDELRDLGECSVRANTSAIPALDDLVPTELHISWDVTLTSEQDRSAIDDVFIFVLDDMELSVEEISDTAAATAAPVEERAAPVPVAATSTAVPEFRPVEAVPAKREAPAVVSQAKAAENVRVPAERLDELMDRVGELVIAQSRLSQLASASTDIALRSVSEEIERLSGELRDTMMVLRMVPVATLFSRFRRLVHDLARETGKVIELVTEGESTEVDKTVIERLADPLVHLVRNSIDHGLETPAERLASGKTEAGTVTLSARQAGGEVIISIKDDGRGINRERVRAKAESSGLIQPGQPLSDSELLQLIFAPGFSTAAAITNLSGRGVGMDVVKKTVEALRGAIDIVSMPGQGSEVSLRIPLTLAIIDGLLVRVGSGRYVIPLSAVEECLELSLEEDLRSRGRSFISLRDSLVPFLRLRDLFRTGTKPDVHQKVVVISTGTERVGLVVDQIIGDHQTVIKSMSKLHNNVATFSGATILGDGSVALILDVGHLVAAGQQQEAQLRVAG
ncbi:chemotaxis protein CheA [Rhizobium leguminosarum]|uniref:Chemotaxis protein CheA n=1 Tax=Rhizobium leguminosarum TaxID=384 RepID=A0A6P0DHW3_RHILE|nr:chemotaxis protein CheA [Rhizobium leguminosarum]MDH6661024.1 two-component system chemotaxis sensor kinase CheA [Rhizobium sophorae]ASS55795.1 chemotaxis protein CheA [Rhizobium leguminosarum bv. viciae]AVC51369.1 signal transducing histidine kinase, homodimeric domain protein [Rhizobium leguminosarum bv. viciae]MBB4329819.1 two-component system chemotaxis sensor kinase CheA [Rhizobium leguminosarum]MBB4343459.1 two-component system chemotaxis sensor kinase CheA [Rhizobium leguminosarum]